MDSPLADPYGLVRLPVSASTSPEAIKRAINYAISEDKWLILCMHYLGETDGLSASCYYQESAFEELVAWGAKQDITVVTQQQGVGHLATPIPSSVFMLFPGLAFIGALRRKRKE